MKQIKLYLLTVMLCIGSYIYSQETFDSAENTGSSPALNETNYIEMRLYLPIVLI